ncbi:GNAT family N-acetyltransferase [Streptomyces xinghaiensis]|uniref:GNAT family N-acetyltransferase n=2 Tax=Streptomyces TaxID=1883 RepID=A0A3R7HWW1_9ACTN|nr:MULTISPECIES: GNAT family N-acetyltransferase [Streptomyces]KNE83335.1 hypothetical protein ADZ36_05805 [Streptomyces fradiae]OFA44232.1 hypothetical protein BEN35_22795 [Streptomyces fradiae]PQM20576.1 N-acetyltransferase [Streptomyces xinghaiensis]RKM92518.1 GNAT family N-acetyltransferase [Streptomyces xinghaiensis]RNC70485.1 GNAT family N-acetyltransferase [Streptomyces xinghaiensis]
MTKLLTLSTYTRDHLEQIRPTLLDVYAVVYTEEIASDPFFSMESFEKRLAGHTSWPGWTCVVGEVDGEPVGYAYGATVPPGGWWHSLRTDVDPALTHEDGARSFGLFEIMVRAPWRGRGIAQGIHDELVNSRPEERAVLLVDSTHPRVRARYEEWGYSKAAQMQPALDSPLYDAMIRDLRADPQ